MKKILIAMPHYRETCTRGYQKLVDHGFEITEIPYDRDYTVEELKEALLSYNKQDCRKKALWKN